MTTDKAATLAYALEKWKGVRAGQRVIFSYETLDALADEFRSRTEDDRDADIFFHSFVTIPNPKRCGIHDAYVGYIQEVESGS